MLETEYKFAEVYDLAKQLDAAADRVQFKNIFNNANGGVALLAVCGLNLENPFRIFIAAVVTQLEADFRHQNYAYGQSDSERERLRECFF